MNRDPISDFPFGFPFRIESQSLPIFQQLVGIIDVPYDKPCALDVIKNLCVCFLAYSKSLGKCSIEFNRVHMDVSLLEKNLSDLKREDTTPVFQLDRRTDKYAAWTLAMQIKAWHRAAQVAYGAEIILSILEGRRLDKNYCKNICRDLVKINDPAADLEFEPEEIAEMQFGQKWIRSFCQIDKQVRRLVVLPVDDPNETKFLYPGLALLDEIKRKINFPDMKHRTASLNHRSLTLSQMKSVCQMICENVRGNDANAILLALEVLTGCQAKNILNMPLSSNIPELWVAVLDVEGGALLLNLDIVFTQRKRPTKANKNLFTDAGSIIRSPLPIFLQTALKRRVEEFSKSQIVGDLLPEKKERYFSVTKKIEVRVHISTHRGRCFRLIVDAISA
jgi:hypothetical protein